VFPELQTSDKIALLRFDGSLYFANAGYFEDKVLELVSKYPNLRYIIIDGEAINQMDSSGEEVLHHLADRLKSLHIEFVVARMKRQFMKTIRRTGLLDSIGEDHFHSRIQFALNYAWDGLGEDYDRTKCPLRRQID
ncbi:sodium-independent anion transporter, partial [endosymbiont of Riftia pachyptila]